MSIWNKLGLASKNQINQLNEKIEQLINLQQRTDQIRIEKDNEWKVRETRLNDQLAELQSKLLYILATTKEAEEQTKIHIEEVRKLLDQYNQYICSKLDNQSEEIQVLNEAITKLNNISLPDISKSMDSLEEIVRITLVNKLITEIDSEFVRHSNV